MVIREADGSERQLALFARRNRWEAAAKTILSTIEAGATVECRDNRARVLYVFDAPAPEPDAAAAAAARTTRLADLDPGQRAIIAAQDHVLDRFASFAQAVLQAQTRTIDALSSRLAATEKSVEKLSAHVMRTTVDAAGAISQLTIAHAEREADLASGEAKGSSPSILDSPAVSGFLGAAATKWLEANAGGEKKKRFNNGDTRADDADA